MSRKQRRSLSEYRKHLGKDPEPVVNDDPDSPAFLREGLARYDKAINQATAAVSKFEVEALDLSDEMKRRVMPHLGLPMNPERWAESKQVAAAAWDEQFELAEQIRELQERRINMLYALAGHYRAELDRMESDRDVLASRLKSEEGQS